MQPRSNIRLAVVLTQADHLARHLEREGILYDGNYPFSIRGILVGVHHVDEYIQIARTRQRWGETVCSLGPVSDFFGADEYAPKGVHRFGRIADTIRTLSKSVHSRELLFGFDLSQEA